MKKSIRYLLTLRIGNKRAMTVGVYPTLEEAELQARIYEAFKLQSSQFAGTKIAIKEEKY